MLPVAFTFTILQVLKLRLTTMVKVKATRNKNCFNLPNTKAMVKIAFSKFREEIKKIKKIQNIFVTENSQMFGYV